MLTTNAKLSYLSPFIISVILCFFSQGCLKEGEGINQSVQDIFPARSSYPEGPYGTEVGTTLENLSFKDTQDQEFDLNMIYQDDFAQLLLITTSAEWCTACIKEQPTLEVLYTEYKERGLDVVVTLFQDRDFEPATPELSARWKDKYDLSFTVLSDSENPTTFEPYYDVSLTPMVMLVDVAKMEIIYLTQGFDEDQVRALIEANLPAQLPKPKTYPTEPYGYEIETTIAPLTFTDLDGEDYHTLDLYQDLSKSMLLLTTSAEWCTACIKEQPVLQDIYEEFSSKGLEVLVTLFQDRDFEPATPEIAQRWKEKYQLDFLVVADSQEPSLMSAYYDVSLTPMVMLVDLVTMEILYLTQGFDEDQVRALIFARLGSDSE